MSICEAKRQGTLGEALADRVNKLERRLATVRESRLYWRNRAHNFKASGDLWRIRHERMKQDRDELLTQNAELKARLTNVLDQIARVAA